MASTRRAFVIMPFGKKKLPDGTEIDCDDIFQHLLRPAIVAAGLAPHRADADRRGGSIHLDMFLDLLLAEFVVADLTMDNPNVWYEIGVRHALRAGGTVMTYAARDRLPFDIAGQRMHRYTLKDGKLDPEHVDQERDGLVEAIKATLGAWRGRRASPVYHQLPNLQEPDWKTFKVGDVNQFWEALDAWRQRIEIARTNKRPGDILLLAEETPNSILEFEALRTAADALLKLRRPGFALSIVDRALAIDPDDVKARQLRGIALGRVERYAEARQVLSALAKNHQDGETLGNLARTWKDEWTQLWSDHPLRSTDPVEAGRDTVETMECAAQEYFKAFCAAPDDYYPGINVLTLGRLWEHLSGKTCQLEIDLDVVSAGVRWAAEVAVRQSRHFWPLLTLGELALVEGRKDDAIDAYRKATALIVRDRDRFALDSTRQQIDILEALGFHTEIVAELVKVLDRAALQLDPIKEPQRVVVFSGHMIDNPAVRGAGKQKPERFPPSKVDAAATQIKVHLDKLHAAAGDLGLCGGASGGDLLFAKACLERGMRLELRLAREEQAFLAESVTFADPTGRWYRDFRDVADNPATKVLVMPVELGVTPEDTSVHDRCNRWILYSALSWGLRRVSAIVLWNGQEGDGPGGTKHMVELVSTLTGRPPEIIDPATL